MPPRVTVVVAPGSERRAVSGLEPEGRHAPFVPGASRPHWQYRGLVTIRDAALDVRPATSIPAPPDCGRSGGGSGTVLPRVSGTLVPARGQGHSSFVNSVLTAVENIYTDVVQPSSHGTLLPKVREGEPPLTDEPVPGEAASQGPEDTHPV